LRVGDELGKFTGGCSVAEAVEVGVFLEGVETVFIDVVQGSLQAFFRGYGR
jgi:hypothetical protein